jgi:tRNA-splicing ligase RtcB
MAGWKGELLRIDENRWRIPKGHKAGMRVDGVIYADDRLLPSIREDQALEQVANVATLPGIVGASLAMPDIHWGYGFPIGGVAATSVEDGVISPGGVGYDINCGVRIVRTNLTEARVRPKLEELISALFATIPSGVGSSGKIRAERREMEDVLTRGVAWAVEKGYGWPGDAEHTEAGGALAGADPGKVSAKAFKRGQDQLGTLGSGNHFLEVQLVEEIHDAKAAEAFGLFAGQVVVAIHSGSRGLGHQVCTDYLEVMAGAVRKYDINLPDRQLACAPVTSPEGEAYFAAMACAANYAWVNRQCLTHWTRQTMARVLGGTPEKLGMTLLYDVAHNIAKKEKHADGGKTRALCVHRKGATRAFPPGHPELPAAYRNTGQPVLVPGDMGRASYVLVGTERAMRETFGSACHGAGRLMSRGEAKRETRGAALAAELAARGIAVRATSQATLAEEAPEAYKNVEDVVGVTHAAGISTRVARMRPLAVMKG